MKKPITLLFSLLIIFGCFCSAVSADLTRYGVNPREAYIEVGQEIKLEPYYETNDGTTRNFSYRIESGDHEGLSYDQTGLIKALKLGDYTVEVGFHEPDVSRYYYCLVTIHVIPGVENLTTSQDHYDIYAHEWELNKGFFRFDPKVSVSPDYVKPIYEIKDPNIVAIDYTELKPKKFGNTSIVITAGKRTKTITVSVIDKDKTPYSTFTQTGKTEIIVPEGSEITPSIPDNVDKQNYNTWAAPVTSYLVKAQNGYMSVSYNNSKLIVDYYNDDFKPVEEKTIDIELPIFGGFLEGKNNFYVVSGQNNPEEDDN